MISMRSDRARDRARNLLALDAVARDYFALAVTRAKSQGKR